jgi:hypothetical protein
VTETSWKIGVWVHAPLAGSQLSVVPAFASSQETGLYTHPLRGSHVSVVHRSESEQVLGW